ncbi:NADase-type glycan-binding domain-containing protein [Streptomyces sp. t39]|uniref:NADase-type glycan-binding domain-containing protein n=1 Tax=Streptomyces sp. t39 TaxID=1828156 RepID=UPI0021C9E14D
MTTQNCAECGTRAEPGQSFCDACGAVLRWDQAPSRAARPASAAPGGPADAAGPGPGAHGAGGPEDRPAPTAAPAPAAPAPAAEPQGAGTGRPDADNGRTAVAAGTAAGLMDSARAARAARAARTAGLAGGPTRPAPGSASGDPAAPQPARHGAGPGAAEPPRRDDGPGGGQWARRDTGHGAGGTHGAAGTRPDDAPQRDDDHRWGSGPRPGADGSRPDGDAGRNAGPPVAPASLQNDSPRHDDDRWGSAHRLDAERSRHADDTHHGGGPTAGHIAAPSGADDDTAPLTGAQGSGAPGDTMSDRARSLLVPVADPEAASPAPAPAVSPVLPGRPDADRPAVRAPGQVPGVLNGAPCSWCSTPNRPDRHYCARCAMPLDETADTAPLRAPWWRRVFGGRSHETPWAGDRPRLRRVFDRIGTWITLAVVITCVILGFLYVPDGIQASRDHFAKRAPVAPDGITASRSYTGHKPVLAFDKRSNTWWGPGVSQSGRGEWIEVSFTEPTRLLDLIITPGVSARPDKIGESALPHRVTATVTGKDGTTTTRRLTLDQGAGGQRRPFRVGEVTKVRFTVESSHAASADKQVAIAEIELFGPSSANRS